MTDLQFNCLHTAVTIAKDKQVSKISRLRELLQQQGYQESDIKVALATWGAQIRRNA